MAATPRFLVVNGVPHTSAGPTPTVASLLESTRGAYTTTRTDGAAAILILWDRHLRRLHRNVLLLSRSHPHLLGSAHPPCCDLTPRIHDSLRVALEFALAERDRTGSDAELAVTALIRGRQDDGDGELDVLLHLGFYVPPDYGTSGAHLAVAGPGRGEAAEAKYSSWARERKRMEKMRPPTATELLLSDDGDQILEGSVTNFFVVCRKDGCSYEVQTAPVRDGVLPGVIRQLVIEACTGLGISFREVAPSWADRDLWEEAFVTSSLRLVQHVETIQVPTPCQKLHLKTWKEVSWVVKQFEGVGVITTQIQKDIVSRARADGYQLSNIICRKQYLNLDHDIAATSDPIQ